MGVRESGLAFLAGALPIFVIGFSYRATDNMVTTTLPLLGEYVFGLGTAYGGAAVTVYGVFGLTAIYLSSHLRASARRKAMIASTGTVTICCFLLAFSGAVSAAILGIAIGFSFGIVSPSIITSTSLVGGQRGERLIAIFTLGLSVSLVFGPLLESYLLTFGYSDVFLVFAIISSLAFLASWRIKFTDVARETPKPGAKAMSGVYAGLLVWSVFFLPFAALATFLPIFAARVFGTDAATSYAAFIPLFAVSLIARVYMTVRPFNKLRFPLLLSFVITSVGLLTMVVAPSFTLFLIVMALIGIPHGITYTLSLIMVSRTSGEDERNASVSRYSAYTYALYIPVPIVLGYEIELVGIQFSFLSLLVPSLVASILFVRLYGKNLV
jgi:predicted MFS family arabinose efflux permease